MKRAMMAIVASVVIPGVEVPSESTLPAVWEMFMVLSRITGGVEKGSLLMVFFLFVFFFFFFFWVFLFCF